MNHEIGRVKTVAALRGVSVSAHYVHVQQGLFTRPIPLHGRAKGWPLSEVEALNAATIAGQSEDDRKKLVVALEAKRKTFAVPVPA